MRVAVVHSFYDDEVVPSGENRVVVDQFGALSRLTPAYLLERRTSVLKTNRFYRVSAAVKAAGLMSDGTVLEELASFRPDVVHVHNTFPNIGHSWIAEVTVPVIVTLHNYRWACANGLFWRDGHTCVECPTRGSHHAVMHRCYRGSGLQSMPLAIATRKSVDHRLLAGATKVVVLNEATAEYVGRFHATSDVHVVPNFVPKPVASGHETHRKGWAFCGRLSAEKGVHTLLRGQFSTDDPLFIAGDGPARPAVVSAAENSDGAVVYLGRLSEAGVDKLLRRVKGLVIPSLWTEGLPTVALRALAARTPVVVSSLCSAGSDLTSDGAGLRYDPTSAGGLTSAKSRISDDFGYFSRQAGRKYEQKYCEEVWADSMMALYQSAVE